MPWLNNNLSQLITGSRQLNNKTVAVGIVTPSTHSTPHGGTIDMAKLYSIQEYGSRKIPARPTLIPAMTKTVPLALNPALLVPSLVSGNINGYLSTVGTRLSDAVKNEIRAKTSPPLSMWTVKARRQRGNTSTKPLIDTGKLIAAINYKIS